MTPDQRVEAAARALCDHDLRNSLGLTWDDVDEQTRAPFFEQARVALAAADAAGRERMMRASHGASGAAPAVDFRAERDRYQAALERIEADSDYYSVDLARIAREALDGAA